MLHYKGCKILLVKSQHLIISVVSLLVTDKRSLLTGYFVMSGFNTFPKEIFRFEADIFYLSALADLSDLTCQTKAEETYCFVLCPEHHPLKRGLRRQRRPAGLPGQQWQQRQPTADCRTADLPKLLRRLTRNH